MNKCTFTRLITIILVNLCLKMAGQDVADGISYQAIVRDMNGAPIPNKLVAVKLGIYSGSTTGVLQWEEIATTLTDQNGLFKLVVGKGVSTGKGVALVFSLVKWDNAAYYIKLEIDSQGGTNFTTVGSSQLFSVPYAFYSKSSDKVTAYTFQQLKDIKVVSLIKDDLIKWNGLVWLSTNDQHKDTVAYARNAAYAKHTDSASYGYTLNKPDSALFAYYSDSAQFVYTASRSLSTAYAKHADTALYAFMVASPVWRITGNSNTSPSDYIGTKDAKDLTFKIGNVEAVHLTSGGNISLPGGASGYSFSLGGNDGILANGNFSSTVMTTAGAGTKFIWCPAKAAFRAGGISGTQWDNSAVGTYSFSGGFNCIAGNSSFASGNTCIANGDYTIAIGRKTQATAIGLTPSGVSIALGDSCIASTPRSLVMGRGCVASTNNAAYAIGYGNTATGAVSTALGTHSMASGNYSFVLGYYGSSNLKAGSFVYADASSNAITKATADNQFMVRASGGTVFYTDSLATMGVTLPAGGGSWTSVCDNNKKENFMSIDGEKLLGRIEKMKIESWTYKQQENPSRHIGAQAKDISRLFQKHPTNVICDMDVDGITLMGIKTLNERLKYLSILKNVDELKDRTEAMNNFDDLNKRLDIIEKQLITK